MVKRIINKTWKADGVFTDPTSVLLLDPTSAYGIKRNDTGAPVVTAGTAFTKVSTGVYQYIFVEPVANIDYTAYIQVVYHGITDYFERDLPAVGAALLPPLLDCSYASLVNDVGYHLFGLRPTNIDVITDGVASANQAADILRSINKGLQFVYSAYRWSFLRPLITITTHPAYNTGTITVDALGNVTGLLTVFPSYSASAGGRLSIPSVGSFAVGSYGNGTSLVLTAYTGGAIVASTTYSLTFDSYSMPTGFDSFEGNLTYPQGATSPREACDKTSEVEIRRLLTWNDVPDKPRLYATTMNAFDPTTGSSRYVTLYPIPDLEYVLTAIGTIRPTMIDAVNKYPLGAEVLAPCITESCLAAAEREIEQKDAGHPDAVHNRALMPLLAMAIRRDKEYAAPETLGVDHGEEGRSQDCPRRRFGTIYWDGGGGFTGYL